MAKAWVIRNLRESRDYRTRLISDAEALAAEYGDEHLVLKVSDVHPLDSFLDMVRELAADAGMSPSEISGAVAQRDRDKQKARGMVDFLKRMLDADESLRGSITVTLQALGKAMRDRDAGNVEGALRGVATAASWFARCMTLYYIEQRRLGAQKMQSQNPKQAAKAQAFNLWRDWQTGRARHKSGAAFARHVVDSVGNIESTKTVERWVTQWRKEAKTKKQASS